MSIRYFTYTVSLLLSFAYICGVVGSSDHLADLLNKKFILNSLVPLCKELLMAGNKDIGRMTQEIDKQAIVIANDFNSGKWEEHKKLLFETVADNFVDVTLESNVNYGEYFNQLPKKCGSYSKREMKNILQNARVISGAVLDVLDEQVEKYFDCREKYGKQMCDDSATYAALVVASEFAPYLLAVVKNRLGKIDEQIANMNR